MTLEPIEKTKKAFTQLFQNDKKKNTKQKSIYSPIKSARRYIEKAIKEIMIEIQIAEYVAVNKKDLSIEEQKKYFQMAKELEEIVGILENIKL